MYGIGKALAALLVSIGGPMLTAILNVFKEGALRRLAAWTTLISLIGALFLGVNSLLASFKFFMPKWLEIGMSWVIPSNFTLCVTTYLSATVLITLYRWKKRGIQIALGF